MEESITDPPQLFARHENLDVLDFGHWFSHYNQVHIPINIVSQPGGLRKASNWPPSAILQAKHLEM